MLKGGRATEYSSSSYSYPIVDHHHSTGTNSMGGGSGDSPRSRYYNGNCRSQALVAPAPPPPTSMNGPVDRVYHFTEDSHKAKQVTSSSSANPNSRSNANTYNSKKNRNRSRAGSGGSLEHTSGSGSNSNSYETIDGPQHEQDKPPAPLIYPPPGLKNVGNSCYANAALQCLLSTALPHALLDERNAHIIRRHSFNRKLLVHGSGSVDSDDETAKTSKDDNSIDGGGSTTGTFGSCFGTYEEEDDDVILARAMGGDSTPRDYGDSLSGLRDLRASPSRAAGRRKRLSKQLQQQQPKDDDTVTSGSTLYSDMYHVMKGREKEEKNERAKKADTEADLLCAWLTQELTQITREYTTPPLGFKAEKRRSKLGRANSPTNFISGLFRGGGAGNDGNGNGNDGNDKCNNRVVDPGSITRHVHKISPCLRPYQQEDSHEFFRALLSSLTMHGQNARLSSLFDGLLESSVTCQTCRKSSLTRDRYMDLSLDIADKSITNLERAFEKFTEDETLSHDNMVTCSRCKVKRVVTKGLRLATAPTMLVINYKRFAYDNYGRLCRLSKPVNFPLRLEIKDYMSRANRGKPPPYALMAVLVHRGRSCDCGHYFAYVRKGKDWYLANDAEVTKVEVEEVLSAQAYVLVYEVEGMKEKHNFDCYSRYHRSCDEADEESMAQEGGGKERGIPTWDFSSLANILEACDAGLCGSLGNVMDTSVAANADHPGRSTIPVASKHSMEEETPPRKSKNRSPRSKGHKTMEDINEADSSERGGDPQVLDASSDVIKSYYKRGRSHTPSRVNRYSRGDSLSNSEHYRKRDRDSNALHDYDPLEGTQPRRAKSLSRVGKFNDKNFKTKKVEGGKAEQVSPRSRSKSRSTKQKQPSRKRVPSRPRLAARGSSSRYSSVNEQRSSSGSR